MNPDQLRAQNWYRNDGNDCFGSSLANLLLIKRDPEMAEKAYHNYQRYELRSPDSGGIDLYLVTRAVRDLTGGRYEGTLYCLPKRIVLDFEPEARARLILQEEIHSRRIRLAWEKKPHQFPAILLSCINQSDSHAFVATGQRCCECCRKFVIIDNGKVRYISGSPLIEGLLEVEKQ